MVGADNQIFILDFGIGCLLAETEGESLVDTMSTANSVASGLDCASPESIMDPQNLTPAGDQYSLGCILYFALTGQYPFPEGSAAEKMMAHQFREPTPIAELNPEVPAELVAIVERLMKKKPDERCGSVGELVEALRPLADSIPAPAAAPSPPATLRMPGRNAEEAQRPIGIPALQGRPGVGPSTPTPRPATMGALPARPQTMAALPNRPQTMASLGNRPPTAGALPSRNTMRAPAGALPTAQPVAQTPVAVPQRREIPGAVPGLPDGDDYNEDRLGPIGITIGAIAACALVWIVAVWLKLL
jgi:serine/threonine-protein kinase